MSARRLLLVSVGVAAALSLGVLPVSSQSGTNADLERIKAEIIRLKSRLEDVRRDARSAEQEIEAADLELGIRTQELDFAMGVQARLEGEQRAVQEQIAGLEPRIATQKQYLRKRLGALYRMGGLSYLRMLLSLDQRRNPIEGMSMLSYLVSRDSRAVAGFQAARVQLAQRNVELVDRQRKLASTRNVVEQRRRELALARDEKQRVLVSLKSESTSSEKQLTELEEKARRLQRLVGVLSRQSATPVPVPQTQGALQGRQGTFGWPVHGKVLERFGRQRNPKFATYTFNNGLKIAAIPGTEVHAAHEGTVLFSQWFKGYGNLIILDHGNRLFSLYGNVKSPAVAVGDRIAAGQVIAGVGESEEAQSGYLYFEIRQDNKPEDPQTWLR